MACTLHKAHLVAALAAHDDVLEVTALVLVNGGARKAHTVAALLKALCRTRDSVAIPGMSTLLGAHREGRVGNG